MGGKHWTISGTIEMLCEAEKNAHYWKNSTLMIIKIYTSTVQYIQRKQQSLSLTRYNPEIYRTYGSLHSSWECHSTISKSINSRNPSWSSSLKSIWILSSHIHTGHLNFYFKHNSHHSVLKQNHLINGKKHSPFLKALLYVIHITHPYFNQQNGLIKKQ